MENLESRADRDIAIRIRGVRSDRSWHWRQLLILVLMLNWLFYRPISGDRLDRRDTHPWQEYWGESYAPELKQRLLKPVFGKLEAEEKIGNLIIDVGSGASPVTQMLKTKPGRKRICVDIAADDGGSLDELRIRLDAEKVGQFSALSFRKAILRVCAFLEINPKTDAKNGACGYDRFFGYFELRGFSEGSEWFCEISQTGWQDYCPQFAPSGQPFTIFRQTVLKTIVSFTHFSKKTILRSNIKRFPKGREMRQTNQRNSLCWWQEGVFNRNQPDDR